MNNVLITGGAGYIGTVLVETLLKYSDQLKIRKIIVYDNLMYKQDGLFPLCANDKIEFIYGDVRDQNKLFKYLSVDTIIPLAGIVGFPACDRDKRLAEDINANQIKFIVENTNKDVKIILPNTNSGYGIGKSDKFCTEETLLNPISTYGITKCLGEKYALESGKAVSLRLATVFGTSYKFRKDLLVNDFVLKALTDKYIVLFESHFKRNYIHIRDVAEVFVRIMGNFDLYKNNVYNVGLSNANLSKLELCEKIKEYVPDLVIKQDEFNKDLDKRNYIVSNDKLESTGWKPKYSLDYGIKELIKSYPIIINSNTKYTNL
jgi:nucleoside-diphosphate-sugar epimerase